MRVERARYLLAAVETGSLRAAAARCGVTQPSLGQQIALLEEDLDVVLLTRSRQGVRPTAAAQALLEPLRRLVAAEQDLQEAAMESSGAYHGRVRIGSVSVTAATIVAPVVARLRAEHRGLRFAIREAASGAIAEDVGAGDLDFGVITTLAGDARPGLTYLPLLSRPPDVCVPRTHPLAQREAVRWSDLDGWPIVTMGEGTVMWELLHQRVPEPDVVVQAASARTVVTMVRHGAGVGLIGRFGSAAEARDLLWLPVLDRHSVRVSLVQRADTQPSRAASVVRQLIRARAAELESEAARDGATHADHHQPKTSQTSGGATTTEARP